jgi:uncharacterized protein YecE (DUF72 family)
MSTVYAGTSGFAYPAWKPGFYPEKLPASRFLEHYAGRLNCVEINYTFRRMPSTSTLESWVAATPPGFSFVIKAHQRITHVQRLKEAEETTEFFLGSLGPLRAAGRLGPVLFQLPPFLKLDLPRLDAYLRLLPEGGRYTFEFRHPSWFTDDVYELLRAHNAALCVAESEKLEVPDVVTADFSYYRLRKPEYSEAEIGGLAARALGLLGEGHDSYLAFKHEEDPGGALCAEQLLALVRGGAAAGRAAA